MPYIKVEMFEGRSIEVKRALVEKLSHVVIEALDCPPEAVWVSIDEKSTENWGIAGNLVSDKHPT